MLIFVIVIRFYIYLTLYLTLRYQICTILRFEVVVRQPRKGLNIVKTADGKSRKVMVR